VATVRFLSPHLTAENHEDLVNGGRGQEQAASRGVGGPVLPAAGCSSLRP
jgi:hypothetical protein